MPDIFAILGTILPALSMMVVIYLLFRSIMGADAKERKVRAQIEAEERAKLAAKKDQG